MRYEKERQRTILNAKTAASAAGLATVPAPHIRAGGPRRRSASPLFSAAASSSILLVGLQYIHWSCPPTRSPHHARHEPSNEPSVRFFARLFSFFDCAFDFPEAAAALLAELLAALLPVGLRAALAVRHPESGSTRGVAALTTSCCSRLPGRSKLHISHSHNEPLLTKVHRGHSQSSTVARTSAARGVPPTDLEPLELCSGLRDTLWFGCDEAAGGLYAIAAIL